MAETAITELIPRERPERKSLGMRVNVLVERTGKTDCETVTGQLNGATPHELTVSVAPPLDLDQAMSLRIKVPELQFDLIVAASVCSTRALDPIRGELTCALDPELPDDALARLAPESRVAALTQQRKTRPVRARVSWAPDAPPVPVRILSLVGTGLRMASTQTAPPSSRFTLLFDTPDGSNAAMPALVQWQLRTAERYLVGCTLENQDDARSARHAIRWLETHRRSRAKTPRSQTGQQTQRWRDVLAVATCAAITAAALVLLIARGQLASPMAAMTMSGSGQGAQGGELTATVSQLADQVAAHDGQLTDLQHALQVVQTDGNAAASQKREQDKPSKLADQVERLDGNLNQLAQQLAGIQRTQQNVLARQRALAKKLVAATTQTAAIEQHPATATATRPPAGPARATVETAGTAAPNTATTAGNSMPRYPSATPRETPHAPAAASAATFRTWSDTAGTHHVKALLLGAADGQARLRTESGRVIDVPIAKLSQADQRFIAAWKPR